MRAERAERSPASVAPATVDEAAAVLREAASHGDTVSFRGGGTELGFGYPARPADVLVRSERLSGVVDYAPADLVIEAEAGLTLAALQALLAPHGQRLAIDPPFPELATLGGLVATNAFGPLRTRYGSFRDLIVGVTLVRADGARVRGGGKVVKNVAGFDLPKLAVGSLGTLGMIATMTFRLHPAPECVRVVRVREVPGPALRRLAGEIVARQLEPSAIFAESADDAYDAYALFEGFTKGVDEQVERYAEAATNLGFRADLLADASAPALRDEAVRTYGNLRVRIAAAPASLDVLEREALQPLRRAFGDARSVVYPSLGIAFVSAYAADAVAAAAALTAARGVAERLAGNAVLLDAQEPELYEHFDVYGTVPPSFPLMARLKDRFDPGRRLNAGRFLGGL